MKASDLYDLHILYPDRRLLSVGKLAERGLNVGFEHTSCVIWNKNQATASGGRWKVLHARMSTGNGAIRGLFGRQQRVGALTHSNGPLEQRRAGKDAARDDWYSSYQFRDESTMKWMRERQANLAQFPSRSKTKTSHVLDFVHTDVMGPMKTESKGGAKYVLTFVDDYSKYVVAYFLKKKSEAPRRFKPFTTMYENQWGERINCLRSDNGTKFVNKALDGICQRNSIVHQKTVPYSPQQNGVAERIIQTMVEKARIIVHYKGVSNFLVGRGN